MEDEEVQKQLEQMVKFIYREADEKANEIQAKGQVEFSIEKSKRVQEEKQKITKDFEKKEKQIERDRKINNSHELNAARLRLYKAREEGVQRILSIAHRKLAEVAKDQAVYKKLLKDLIAQGLGRLQEEEVTVVCRKQDLSLVEAVMNDAVQEYQRSSGSKVKATVDKTLFLPPGPEHTTKEGEICSGGVVLSSNDGKIICANTLDARLSMAFEQNLPAIRTILYGKSTTRIHYD